MCSSDLDYVLEKPPAEEREAIEGSIARALEIMPQILAGDLQGAMQKLHSQDKPVAPKTEQPAPEPRKAEPTKAEPKKAMRPCRWSAARRSSSRRARTSSRYMRTRSEVESSAPVSAKAPKSGGGSLPLPRECARRKRATSAPHASPRCAARARARDSVAATATHP